MKTIHYILLISPPGGGKSTWLHNHDYDIKIDDISVNPTAMKDLSAQINELKISSTIAIADINLCDLNILKKAWEKLSAIAQEHGFNCDFEHILFLGEKVDYLKNVEKRDDGRNVYASVVRFAPRIKDLVEQEIPNKTIIHIQNYTSTYKASSHKAN